MDLGGNAKPASVPNSLEILVLEYGMLTSNNVEPSVSMAICFSYFKNATIIHISTPKKTKAKFLRDL